jgi:hypothetical protein
VTDLLDLEENAVSTFISNNAKTSPGFKVPKECITPSVIMLWRKE